MTSARQVVATIPPFSPKGTTWAQRMARGFLNAEAIQRGAEYRENCRMAPVEAQREADLILSAQAERRPGAPITWQSVVWNEGARAREIARCEAEIRGNQSKPVDVNEKAAHVALGTMDWEAERALLQGQTWPTRNIGRQEATR